ncbi:cytochrome P450 [Streptomyces sp. NPDC051104]|uniref:cytochrome P450 n=1 Tax=Streptomyces sp. NPDC051104 TaxID=3155044 RepID=UPI003417373A
MDPLYTKLQEKEPVCRVQMPYGEQSWLAMGYREVQTVLSDPRFSMAVGRGRDEPRIRPRQLSEERSLMGMDPPELTRLRRLVARAFTPRRAQLLRPRVQKIAEGIVDHMTECGPPADLVEDFSLPYSIAVICELLGVPYGDRHDFRTWAEAFVTASCLSEEETWERIARLAAYMAALIAERREKPADDLLSAMIQARDEDHDRLTEDELLHLAVVLLVAGYETLANQIPDSVYVLLTLPEQLAFLRERPERIPCAVDELLRYIPSGNAGALFPRYATEDVLLGGCTVKAGDPVLISLHAANRDPRVFPDPHTVDLTRTPNPHIGFGYGAHTCLGAHLARVEIEIALGTLLSRFAVLRLEPDADSVEWKEGMVLRGPSRMPIAW